MPLVAKIGNIVKEKPALQHSKDKGTPYVRFSIKEAKPYGADEAWEPRFYNVTAFKDMAERVCRDLDKGDRVIVVGTGERREYDKNDGTKGVSNDITADEIGTSLRFCGVDVHRGGSTEPTPQPYAVDEEPF